MERNGRRREWNAMEEEENNKINFLDVANERKENFSITSVYRKPTQTAVSIKQGSNHHPSHILANIHSQVHRAINYCNTKDQLEEELRNIQTIAGINNIAKNKVDKIWKKTEIGRAHV